MTEPEYVYIKGEGWVLTVVPTCEYAIITNRNGETFRLERRKPNPGEAYSFNFGKATWSFDSWIKWAQTTSSPSRRAKYPQERDKDVEYCNNVDWVAMVEL